MLNEEVLLLVLNELCNNDYVLHILFKKCHPLFSKTLEGHSKVYFLTCFLEKK